MTKEATAASTETTAGTTETTTSATATTGATGVFIPGVTNTTQAATAAATEVAKTALTAATAQAGAVVPNSGDPLIDSALSQFAGSAKLSDAEFHALFDGVLKTGDAGQLDQLALAEKLGTDMARQAVELMQGVSKHIHQRAQTIGTQIHEMVGGREAWAKAVEAFNATQPDFVKTQVNMMLGSGNPDQLKYAVDQVMRGALSAGAIPTTHSAAGGTPAGVAQGALNADGFRTGLADIRKKYGSNASLESGPAAAEFAALLQRRNAGRSAGL